MERVSVVRVSICLRLAGVLAWDIWHGVFEREDGCVQNQIVCCTVLIFPLSMLVFTQSTAHTLVLLAIVSGRLASLLNI